MTTIRFVSEEHATCGAYREEDGRLSCAQWIYEATGSVRDVPLPMVPADKKLPTMQEIYKAARMRKILDAPELDLTGYQNDERIAVPCVLETVEV